MNDGSSLAVIEISIFLGLVGWLVYYQYSSSRRGPSAPDSEENPSTDARDKEDSAPPGS